MPLPLPIPGVHPTPGSTMPVTNDRYYVRERQPWAVQQEHMRHDEALYTVGEYAMFCLMWHIEDFQLGYVGRCTTCFVTGDSVEDVVARAYAQPKQNRCPDCFGTTFEGGFKAQIIRPAIFSDTDESETFDRRGVIHPDDVDLESTTDFRVRSGDYLFRSNGTRWFLRVPQRITLRTGFGYPGQAESAIGYNHARATQEDPTSVAYLIPPSSTVLISLLRQDTRLPADFSAHEILRAPSLIPPRD